MGEPYFHKFVLICTLRLKVVSKMLWYTVWYVYSLSVLKYLCLMEFSLYDYRYWIIEMMVSFESYNLAECSNVTHVLWMQTLQYRNVLFRNDIYDLRPLYNCSYASIGYPTTDFLWWEIRVIVLNCRSWLPSFASRDEIFSTFATNGRWSTNHYF